MNLYIDTATTDRWKFPNKGVPRPDSDQPYMVRLAWLLEADAGRTVREACHLIRLPADEQMAGEAAHWTGIYDHQVQARGRDLFNVLSEFADSLGEIQQAEIQRGEPKHGTGFVVGHSWEFHKQVLERSFRLVGMPARTWPPNICTMIKSTDIVQVPKQTPGGGYKWPSFDEASERMTGKRYAPTMDPVADGFARVRTVRLFLSHIMRS